MLLKITPRYLRSEPNWRRTYRPSKTRALGILADAGRDLGEPGLHYSHVVVRRCNEFGSVLELVGHERPWGEGLFREHDLLDREAQAARPGSPFSIQFIRDRPYGFDRDDWFEVGPSGDTYADGIWLRHAKGLYITCLGDIVEWYDGRKGWREGTQDDLLRRG